MPVDKNKELLLQKVIIAKKWVSKKDLVDCLAIQKQTPNKALSEILIEKGLITRTQSDLLMGFINKKIQEKAQPPGYSKLPEGMDRDANAKMAGYLATMEALNEAKTRKYKSDSEDFVSGEASKVKFYGYIGAALIVLLAGVLLYNYYGGEPPEKKKLPSRSIQIYNAPEFATSAEGFKLLDEWRKKDKSEERNKTIEAIIIAIMNKLEKETSPDLKRLNPVPYFVKNDANLAIIDKCMEIDYPGIINVSLLFYNRLRVPSSDGILGKPFDMERLLHRYMTHKDNSVRFTAISIMPLRMPAMLADAYRGERDPQLKNEIVRRMKLFIHVNNDVFCDIIYNYYNETLQKRFEYIRSAFKDINNNALKKAEEISNRSDSIAERSNILASITAHLNETKDFCATQIASIPPEVYKWYNRKARSNGWKILFFSEEGFPVPVSVAPVISDCIRSDVSEIAVPMILIASYLSLKEPYEKKGTLWTIRDMIIEPLNSGKSSPVIKATALDAIYNMSASILVRIKRETTEARYSIAQRKAYNADASDLVYNNRKITRMQYWLLEMLSNDDEAGKYAEETAIFFNKAVLSIKGLIFDNNNPDDIRAAALDKLSLFPAFFYADVMKSILRNPMEKSIKVKSKAVAILGNSRDVRFLEDPFLEIIADFEKGRRSDYEILSPVIMHTMNLVREATYTQSMITYSSLFELLHTISGDGTIPIKLQILDAFIQSRGLYNNAMAKYKSAKKRYRPAEEFVQTPPANIAYAQKMNLAGVFSYELERRIIAYAKALLGRDDKESQTLLPYALKLVLTIDSQRLDKKFLINMFIREKDQEIKSGIMKILSTVLEDAADFEPFVEDYKRAHKDNDWDSAWKILYLLDGVNYMNKNAAKAITQMLQTELLNKVQRANLRIKLIVMLSKRAHFDFVVSVFKKILEVKFAKEKEITEEERHIASVAVEIGETNRLYSQLVKSAKSSERKELLYSLERHFKSLKTNEAIDFTKGIVASAKKLADKYAVPSFTADNKIGDWVLFSSSQGVFLKTLIGLEERSTPAGSEIFLLFEYIRLNLQGSIEGNWKGEPVAFSELRTPTFADNKLIFVGNDYVKINGKNIKCSVYVYPTSRKLWKKRWYPDAAAGKIPFGPVRETNGERRELDEKSADRIAVADMIVEGSFADGKVQVTNVIKGNTNERSFKIDAGKSDSAKYALEDGKKGLWILTYNTGSNNYFMKDSQCFIEDGSYKVDFYNMPSSGDEKYAYISTDTQGEYVFDGKKIYRFGFARPVYDVKDYGVSGQACAFVNRSEPGPDPRLASKEGDWAFVKEGGDTWYFIEIKKLRDCPKEEYEMMLPKDQIEKAGLDAECYVKHSLKRNEAEQEGMPIYQFRKDYEASPFNMHLVPGNVASGIEFVEVPGRGQVKCRVYKFENLSTGTLMQKYISDEVPFGNVLRDVDGKVINYEVLSFGHKGQKPDIGAAFELYKERVKAMGFEQKEGN